MKPLSFAIFNAAAVLLLLIVAYNAILMVIAHKQIFSGSGKPVRMAQAVISTIQSTSQFLFGIGIVAAICILMVEKIIDSQAGIPLVSSIIGFLLGRGVKDSSLINDKEEG